MEEEEVEEGRFVGEEGTVLGEGGDFVNFWFIFVFVFVLIFLFRIKI